MSNIDGATTIGTVTVNITYNVLPATYQNIDYVVNLPPIWQEKNAKIYANDAENTILNLSSRNHGVSHKYNYGYTTDNTSKSSIKGKNNYQYIDTTPNIEGLGDYRGSTGYVGFSTGKSAFGMTGPNIKFQFGSVGYNVNWVV